MIIKTSRGFEYEVEDAAADDMELLDALMDADDGNVSAIRRAMILLIGEEGKKQLYDNCRGESGRVSASAVMEEFKEILNNAPKEIKNS